MAFHTNQVSDKVLLENRRSPSQTGSKRARLNNTAAGVGPSEPWRSRGDGQEPKLTEHSLAVSKASRETAPITGLASVHKAHRAIPKEAVKPFQTGIRGCGKSAVRDSSRSPSTSSSFSGATTSAALSSRASLSCGRSSVRRSHGRSSWSAASSRSPVGSSRSFSRPAYTSQCLSRNGGYFPTPAPWYGSRRRGRESDYIRLSRTDRNTKRESSRRRDQRRSRERSDASSGHDRVRVRGCKRSRSSSSECSRKNGVECTRCLKWCRNSRDTKPITRTLPMEYWVRTPECKAVKSRHIEYIDKVAYSREQFIEETVFTCPFTGVQRDIILERNMFPYDVPTDVEHWTLWSRRDLDDAEMEQFVTKWAAENHPHVVEWECDNNEGDRSIDWYHVHVFFRLDCTDNSGARRDPASVYTGPCGTPPITTSEVVANDAEQHTDTTTEMMA